MLKLVDILKFGLPNCPTYWCQALRRNQIGRTEDPIGRYRHIPQYTHTSTKPKSVLVCKYKCQFIVFSAHFCCLNAREIQQVNTGIPATTEKRKCVKERKKKYIRNSFLKREREKNKTKLLTKNQQFETLSLDSRKRKKKNKKTLTKMESDEIIDESNTNSSTQVCTQCIVPSVCVICPSVCVIVNS